MLSSNQSVKLSGQYVWKALQRYTFLKSVRNPWYRKQISGKQLSAPPKFIFQTQHAWDYEIMQLTAYYVCKLEAKVRKLHTGSIKTKPKYHPSIPQLVSGQGSTGTNANIWYLPFDSRTQNRSLARKRDRIYNGATSNHYKWIAWGREPASYI